MLNKMYKDFFNEGKKRLNKLSSGLPSQVAEDLISNTFFKVLKRLDPSKSYAQKKNYFLSALKNALLNYITRDKKRERSMDLNSFSASEITDPVYYVTLNEIELRAYEIANTLLSSEKIREGFKLAYMLRNGHSFESIRALTGIPVSTIERKKEKALKNLEKIMDQLSFYQPWQYRVVLNIIFEQLEFNYEEEVSLLLSA